MKKLVLSAIRHYQKSHTYSTAILRSLHLAGGVCRFHPTCSEYTYQAVDKYGSAKGLWIGLKRIVRCHPWNKGGLDPVQ